ncbi:SurA N-terminal domain-containing protein [Caenimonas aquaedulcis]|uniref:Periplasmic chaperone PpiD n=1 Tax=Caenimonas aquaedulcis TaxID=2793270 RepID=A0A931H2G1_9BURK|nr:SurA N-terminal domain-containing protein [Caenimonas aquaedulcis]MBG9387325.1 SurA N-terminal domain-containing protein [Caenimonas aquaedulcis]
MFDFVRKHTKIMQFLLFLLIFPSFVLVGINGYNRMQEKGEAVAKVDGHEIRQGDWDAAHKQQVDRLRQKMPDLDAKVLESPAARYSTLEQLIHDRVLAAAAEKMHLQVSDQRFKRILAADKSLDAFYNAEGKLDSQRFMAATGMSPEQFRANLMNDMAARQVLAGAGGTAFATAAQTNAVLDAYFEKREAQFARFAAADYASRVNPTDAELEAYYKANTAQFQSAEHAAIEYIVLDIETIRKSIAVNEQDLKTYFEQNQARLAGPEERRASHILVKSKQKAEELLAAVKKAPDSFADLARKNSEDPGTKDRGGDLDFFTRGAMAKPFEDAVFGMKKGDIAGPVETQFGWHVIKLTDLKVPKVRTFEEMKPELEAELRKQQAPRKFSEAAEAFTDTVYQQPDSLKPAADKLKLDIQKADVRRTPTPGATGALSNAKFLAALFSPDSLEKKHNTESIEVAPSTLVSGRVVQYSPARTVAFAEVKDQVRERVVAARSAELAKKDGMEKLAAWKANPASATLPPAVTVSRQDMQKQPAPLVDAAMRADPTALPALSGVDLGENGYAIVKVNKVLPREAPPANKAAQERAQFAQALGTAENAVYYNVLKERLKVQMKVPKPPMAPDLQ